MNKLLQRILLVFLHLGAIGLFVIGSVSIYWYLTCPTINYMPGPYGIPTTFVSLCGTVSSLSFDNYRVQLILIPVFAELIYWFLIRPLVARMSNSTMVTMILFGFLALLSVAFILWLEPF